MIKILDSDYEDTIAIKIAGELVQEDYARVVPYIEDRIEKEGSINFYCELEDFEKIEPGAVWKDLKFDSKHYDDFTRVAIVGDKQWMDWMAKFAKPFTTAQVMYFDDDKKQEAWNWVMKKGGEA